MKLEKQIEDKENFMNNVAIVQDNKGNIIYNKDNIQNLTKNHLGSPSHTVFSKRSLAITSVFVFVEQIFQLLL